jgi:hypothetical protein
MFIPKGALDYKWKNGNVALWNNYLFFILQVTCNGSGLTSPATIDFDCINLFIYLLQPMALEVCSHINTVHACSFILRLTGDLSKKRALVLFDFNCILCLPY